jgi:hypothetical protein
MAQRRLRRDVDQSAGGILGPRLLRLAGSERRRFLLAGSFWAGGFNATGAAAIWVSHDAAQTWVEVHLPVDPTFLYPLVLSIAVQAHGGRILAGINASDQQGGEIRVRANYGATLRSLSSR